MTFHTARLLLLVALAWSSALPALAQSGTLARIQRDQTIVIGYASGAAPFSSGPSPNKDRFIVRPAAAGPPHASSWR